MEIQKLSDQTLKAKKLPAQAIVIQLLDKDGKHLAFIACRHEKFFALFDSDNDRETSHFLEEISNFEAEILREFFILDDELKNRFGGFTGEFIITDANSDIFYHEKSA